MFVENGVILSIAGSVFGLLLAIIAFFLIRLVSKVDKTYENIIEIDRKIAHYEVKILAFDTSISSLLIKNEENKDELNSLKMEFTELLTEHKLKHCQPARR